MRALSDTTAPERVLHNKGQPEASTCAAPVSLAPTVAAAAQGEGAGAQRAGVLLYNPNKSLELERLPSSSVSSRGTAILRARVCRGRCQCRPEAPVSKLRADPPDLVSYVCVPCARLWTS